MSDFGSYLLPHPDALEALMLKMRANKCFRLKCGDVEILLEPDTRTAGAERDVEAERQDRAEQDEAMLFASSEGFPR